MPLSAQATITVVPQPPPPPPPVVTTTRVQEVLNKKHQLTEVIITFSGAVNSAEAGNTGIYRLATAGKHGSYTAKNAVVIMLKKASYQRCERHGRAYSQEGTCTEEAGAACRKQDTTFRAARHSGPISQRGTSPSPSSPSVK